MCFQDDTIGVRTGSVGCQFAGWLASCLLAHSILSSPRETHCQYLLYCAFVEKECTKFNAQHPVAFKQARPCIIYRDT